MKRREIQNALREDMRLASMQENLQRMSQQVEAFRRFSSRESEAGLGNRNQIENMQSMIREEMNRNKELEKELEQERNDGEQMRTEMQTLYESKIENLEQELCKVREMLSTQDISSSSENPKSNIAMSNMINMQRKSENDLKLAQIRIKELEKSLERATRRAERAERSTEDIRKLLEAYKQEQDVKDSQIEGLKDQLQGVYSSNSDHNAANRSSTESKVSHGDNEEDSYVEVLEMELEAMRDTYESRIKDLTDSKTRADQAIRELRQELSARK